MSTKKQTKKPEDTEAAPEYGDMSREALERDIKLAGSDLFLKRYEPYIKPKTKVDLPQDQAVRTIVSQIQEDLRQGVETPHCKPMAVSNEI